MSGRWGRATASSSPSAGRSSRRPAGISHPRISPDGRGLAFLEHPAYGNDLGYVALADSQGKVTRLTQSTDGAQGLAWGPGGKELWFSASPLDDASKAPGVRYKLFAVRAGSRPRLVYGPPADLWLQDISATGAVLLASVVSRSEVGGRLAGDSGDRDLSTWSDEGASGISDDGSVFAGIEQSAARVGLDPFVTRIDLSNGERRLAMEIAPRDPAGALYGNILLARDGEHYVYRMRRVTTLLFLAEGLR